MLTAVVGCSSPDDAHPFAPVTYTPRFDPTFTAAEVDAIEAGFAEWPRTVDANIVVVRVTDTEPHLESCPARDRGGANFFGYTFRGESTCIYVDDIARYAAPFDATLTQVSAHEYGHQIGLDHYSGELASIMHAYTADDAPAPTALDVDDLPSR